MPVSGLYRSEPNGSRRCQYQPCQFDPSTDHRSAPERTITRCVAGSMISSAAVRPRASSDNGAITSPPSITVLTVKPPVVPQSVSGDRVLRDVNETTCEITRVRCFQSAAGNRTRAFQIKPVGSQNPKSNVLNSPTDENSQEASQLGNVTDGGTSEPSRATALAALQPCRNLIKNYKRSILFFNRII